MTWATTASAMWMLTTSMTGVAAANAEPQQAAVRAEQPNPRHDPAPQRREPPPGRREPAAPGKPDAAGPGRKGPPTGARARRGCLSTSETREMMSAKRLIPPFMALRSAGSHARGETIGVRLCRHGNDDLIYEINVLRRDGRVVKVILDAANGKILRSINDR